MTSDTRSDTSLRLPSIEVFREMPLSERTALFLSWAATQPADRPVNYRDRYGCALASFGRAITGYTVTAGANGFIPRNVPEETIEGSIPDHPEHIPVMKDGSEESYTLASTSYGSPFTYGKLVTKLAPLVAATQAV